MPPAAAADLPAPGDALQPDRQIGDPLSHPAAVHLQLGLPRPSGADAALLPGQMGPLAGQPGQQIFQLGQLHLGLGLPRLGPAGEDVQDQSAAVDNLEAMTVSPGVVPLPDPQTAKPTHSPRAIAAFHTDRFTHVCDPLVEQCLDVRMALP